jgi:hypothetical protein
LINSTAPVIALNTMNPGGSTRRRHAAGEEFRG